MVNQKESLKVDKSRPAPTVNANGQRPNGHGVYMANEPVVMGRSR
jgi:hypothetical protein